MIERHHILHDRTHWQSQEPQRMMRSAKGMIVPLDSAIHRPELHRLVPSVPLISFHIAKRALELYEPSPDGVEAISNMQEAIDRARQYKKTHRIEQQLAGLAIRSLGLQIPFIKKGQIGDSYK